jgi:subtilisin family serine protease
MMVVTLPRRIRHPVLLFALLLAAMLLAGPGGAMAQTAPDDEVVPDQIIVKYQEDVGAGIQADIRSEEGLEKKDELGLIDAEVLKVEGQPVEVAISNLNDRPEVEYAEPDFKVYPAGYADEERFGELWGLNNTGQNGGTPDVDINGLEASGITQGEPNLVVAVIDDGVDFSHPDLADRAWVNPGESGGGKETNGIDDDGNGYVDDVNGWDFRNDDNTLHHSDTHGTHVAGTIAASSNGVGVVGIAPNVKIMALKFMGTQGGTIKDAIKAITYAERNGAKISNNSWGGADRSQALRDAIQEASDSLFVAAAGNGGDDDIGDDNDGPNPFYPASYNRPNILAVAAINRRGNLAGFSNYGVTSVDISAPGVNILSSVPGSPPGWELYSGTSMATPHATGAAALAASVNPALLGDPVALKKVLMDGGKPLPATEGKTVTGDMVDAEAALRLADTTPPDAPTLDLETGSDTGSSNDDDITNINRPTFGGKAEANSTVRLYEGDKLLGEAKADKEDTTEGKKRWSITVSEALGDGRHIITANARDAVGNVSPSPDPQLTLTIDTTAPMLNILAPENKAEVELSGGIPAPSFAPTDALSGIDAKSDELTKPQTASGVGTYTYKAEATDRAGNPSTEVRTFKVVYGRAYNGILQPINASGTSNFRLGRTIPVKFQLLLPNGMPIDNAVATLWVQKLDPNPSGEINEAISTSASTTGNEFRYDDIDSQYIFNLSTKDGYVNPSSDPVAFDAGTWKVIVKLDDGSTRSATFDLTR